MKKIITLLILLFAYNQIQSQTFNGDQKEIDIILKNTENFSKYVMASDFDNIDASYTMDAKIFPNNSEILEGAAIKKYWTHPVEINITHHKIIQSEITIVGKTAYDYGYYEGKTKKAKGKEQSWGGKYVIVWKKIDGDWKMYLDIWNNTTQK